MDQPELSTAVVSDIATFSQEASCGSTPESSCIAAFAGDVSGPPPKRNGYASAPLFASYSGEVYGGKGPFTVRAPLVLLYGGVATVGGPPPTRVFGECGWPGCTPAPCVYKSLTPTFANAALLDALRHSGLPHHARSQQRNTTRSMLQRLITPCHKSTTSMPSLLCVKQIRHW